MEYFNSLRVAMLEIIERKLKELLPLSSLNYYYLDKNLNELELLLMKKSEQGDFEKCSQIKIEIIKRIKKSS
jgi:hypothetical protein